MARAHSYATALAVESARETTDLDTIPVSFGAMGPVRKIPAIEVPPRLSPIATRQWKVFFLYLLLLLNGVSYFWSERLNPGAVCSSCGF